MSRGRWKREHELPSFPFHCYTNPDTGRHTRACRAAGIAHSHPWYWRRTAPDFAMRERQAWDLWVRTAVAAVGTPLRRSARVKPSTADRDGAARMI